MTCSAPFAEAQKRCREQGGSPVSKRHPPQHREPSHPPLPEDFRLSVLAAAAAAPSSQGSCQSAPNTSPALPPPGQDWEEAWAAAAENDQGEEGRSEESEDEGSAGSWSEGRRRRGVTVTIEVAESGDGPQWLSFSEEHSKVRVADVGEADLEWYRHCMRKLRNKRPIAAMESAARAQAAEKRDAAMQRRKAAAGRALAQIMTRHGLKPRDSVACSHPRIPFALTEFSA
eukprot:Hpha_TRINITY_DN16952_c3_g3::TRINITY_DN16952_c3_g3_i1::g.53796::m.53796